MTRKAHGRFVWHELATTDTEAATAFYRKVAGWEVLPNDMNDMPYTILGKGERGIAGLMALPEEAKARGARPAWMGYIAVADIEALMARLLALGGRQHYPPTDIPNVGRFAVVADPQGAAFCLLQLLRDGPPPAMPSGATGLIGWNELMAGDQEKVFPFYAELFGWKRADAVPMGPMGVYQLFGLGEGEQSGCESVIGGMMTKPPVMPMPFWCYYISVESIAAAKGRLEQAGGQVINGPMEVPGGIWVLQALDPQGVFFCLMGPQS
ncbi:VOC family protein [Acetobacteraceae bacterium H6797]|nr:VOC family protein [Acetobacteraceae bacterium H6797]